jgi:hypothetical protein
MTKKLAIIGKGTSGSQAVIHYLRWMPDCEIHWYFDENIPTQSVGEGSVLTLPRNLFENMNFSYVNLDKIDATLKVGIYKSGWGKTGKPFLHGFPPPDVGLHFNAVALQNYILESVKDKVTLHNENISVNDVDADYIMDCSGKPSCYDDFTKSSYIPVNAAYITQCPWEYPKFQYTLTIARPYGWVFGIPLKNRCSIGYLFNRNIDDLSSIKEDVKEIFKQYELNPSEKTSYLEFENYYRKKNYEGNIARNGNNSFFLEPLEATSISLMNMIQRASFDLWNGTTSAEDLNLHYRRNVSEIETMIMMHYFSGSDYDTKFWRYAQDKGQQAIDNAIKYDNRFVEFVKYAIDTKYSNICEKNPEYGTWWAGAFCQNLIGLGLENILND